MPSFSAKISVREVGDKTISYSLDTDLSGEVSLKKFLEFTKRSLLTIALDTLKEEQLKGFDPKPLVYVDGSKNKPLINVNPLGKIEFISTTAVAGLDLLKEAYNEILYRSKVVTGTYIESNYVFHNGTQIATNLNELISWTKSGVKLKYGDTIRFVNVMPYARKLERYGITAQKSRVRMVKTRDKQKRSGDKIKAPNGAYFLSSRVLASKYGKNMGVYFSFLTGDTLGLQGVPAVTKDGKVLRRNYKPPQKSTGWQRKRLSGPYLYPTIKLVIRGVGIA